MKKKSNRKRKKEQRKKKLNGSVDSFAAFAAMTKKAKSAILDMKSALDLLTSKRGK